MMIVDRSTGYVSHLMERLTTEECLVLDALKIVHLDSSRIEC
jgi:hypothetical protein